MPLAEKPELEAVLSWAGVEFRPDRQTQMCSCFLHDDKTPSMSVDFTKQLWHCNSCGEGGSSWDVIMKEKNVDFRGAAKVAATERFAARASGGGDDLVPGLVYGRGARVPRRKGNRRPDGGFLPPWRR